MTSQTGQPVILVAVVQTCLVQCWLWWYNYRQCHWSVSVVLSAEPEPGCLELLGSVVLL